MEEENNTFKLGSKEMKAELESEYIKFSLGQPTNITILRDEDIEKKTQEFEKEGEKKEYIKYDVKILVDKKKKTWSVSRKVLTTIEQFIDQTDKFTIILREKSYEVIPLNIKSKD